MSYVNKKLAFLPQESKVPSVCIKTTEHLKLCLNSWMNVWDWELFESVFHLEK